MPRNPSESAARRDKAQPAARARAPKSFAPEPSVKSDSSSSTSTPQPSEPTSPEQRIADRAYLKWLSRGCPVGDDKRDWFEAEAEVRRETEPA